VKAEINLFTKRENFSDNKRRKVGKVWKGEI
jgi:hypothetical protein